MERTELSHMIIELRNAIRYARDQKLDDRCWLDYYQLYKIIDIKCDFNSLPSYDEGMSKCVAFYHNRRSDFIDALPSDTALDREKWDNDLSSMDFKALYHEIDKITKAAVKHYSILDIKKTIEDDRGLYRILPEKMPADFRLPPKEEFLEGVKPCAGCPNFWKSHQKCETEQHNLHAWGPCKKY